jgi:hypothetical protein
MQMVTMGGTAEAAMSMTLARSLHEFAKCKEKQMRLQEHGRHGKWRRNCGAQDIRDFKGELMNGVLNLHVKPGKGRKRKLMINESRVVYPNAATHCFVGPSDSGGFCKMSTRNPHNVESVCPQAGMSPMSSSTWKTWRTQRSTGMTAQRIWRGSRGQRWQAQQGWRQKQSGPECCNTDKDRV